MQAAAKRATQHRYLSGGNAFLRPRYAFPVLGASPAKTGSQVLVPFIGLEDSPRHLKLMGDLGQAKVVRDMNSDYTYCMYDSDIATGCGVATFMFLLISQALIMGVTRCLCCGSSLRPRGSSAWAIVLFIATWLAFIIVEACFVGGAARNSYHTKYKAIYNVTNQSCETLRKGFFAAGASFRVFTLILSELYYVSFARSKEGGWMPYGREYVIGMSTFP